MVGHERYRRLRPLRRAGAPRGFVLLVLQRRWAPGRVRGAGAQAEAAADGASAVSRLAFWAGWLWALPTALVGLVVTLPLGCRPFRFRDGVLYLVAPKSGPWAVWARQGFVAITFGQLMMVSSEMQTLDARLMRHELRHFQQARRLGVFFLPVYGLLSLLAMVLGRSAYSGNLLELDADEAAGR